jgi:hypothetical protein
MEPPLPVREPKRQSLPKVITASVPTLNDEPEPPVPVQAEPPKPETTKVPVATYEITLPLLASPSLPAIATPALTEEAPAELPTSSQDLPLPQAEPSAPEENAPPPPSPASEPANLYDQMTARLKGIKPPSVPPPSSDALTTRSNGLPSGTVAYMREIISGAVRNDFLLGIVYAAPPAERDDLTALKGIAEVLQQRLHDMGVFTYKQIALWSHEQALEFSSRLGFKDRAPREHWMEQARDLHEKKYGTKL